ncbi:MAG TPA: ribbon-helix-helix domain-containing protein [Acetobacteraceae bacterium]|nr:ribbon-helix-helix domain-containing protein [Acetobacteraceae bacterium]
MSASTRWNLIVSRTTDDALRQFLASRGRGRKGELSRFVEEAVQARILELAAEDAKRQNAHLSPDEITDAVDEALERARRA